MQSYQALFDKMKSIIKEDACMKFYEEKKTLCLKTDSSGVGLRAGPIQTRIGTMYPRDVASDNTIMKLIAFAHKSLSATEKNTLR